MSRDIRDYTLLEHSGVGAWKILLKISKDRGSAAEIFLFEREISSFEQRDRLRKGAIKTRGRSPRGGQTEVWPGRR